MKPMADRVRGAFHGMPGAVPHQTGERLLVTLSGGATCILARSIPIPRPRAKSRHTQPRKSSGAFLLQAGHGDLTRRRQPRRALAVVMSPSQELACAYFAHARAKCALWLSGRRWLHGGKLERPGLPAPRLKARGSLCYDPCPASKRRLTRSKEWSR
jgi:hypothetical protein